MCRLLVSGRPGIWLRTPSPLAAYLFGSPLPILLPCTLFVTVISQTHPRPSLCTRAWLIHCLLPFLESHSFSFPLTSPVSSDCFPPLHDEFAPPPDERSCLRLTVLFPHLGFCFGFFGPSPATQLFLAFWVFRRSNSESRSFAYCLSTSPCPALRPFLLFAFSLKNLFSRFNLL